MAEPIRKPVHRPRPPHPHTQSRPHAVLVRSRMLPQELDPTPLPPLEISPKTPPAPAPLTLLPPKVRTAPLPTAPPLPAPPLDSGPDPLPTPALAPEDDLTLFQAGVERGRSARRLLLGALALHGGALLAALPGPASDPAFNLGPAELVLAGCVLLSGGMMLVLGRR